MNRRSPNPISRAATVSADVGQGHPPRIHDVSHTRAARASPLTRRPHPCRALIEAAQHAARTPAYRDLYQSTKKRLGKQRGSRVAAIVVARRLAEASWWMLTRDEPFAPAGAA
jgi:hypothetical protein